MQISNPWKFGAIVALTLGAAIAQPPQPPAQPGRGGRGGFVPGQQRPPFNPEQVARGKTLYGVSCTGCHGADLRGGDMGGPNLLRSQLALSDKDGELLGPVIVNGRPGTGMPAFQMSTDDAKALSAYIRSVLETLGRQGMPPATGIPAPSILVGNAGEGKAFFSAKCSGCHSTTGDLQGIATRISDARALQNTWISGGGRGGRGGGRGGANPRTPMVTVTMPGGEKIEGRVARIDDFFVTIALEDGTIRTIRRNGTVPKVEVRDPLKGHRDLLPVYTDKDIHDVTAYLVTLK